ncbi:MAG: hypothetical protein FD161_62 [Limisphaerales bacterium]|nr:MAG: hypothetical protein FD161_62 [Limisphaerales bacterium]KAG0510508.1 MAG: hypothetical protein E1N63_62 [Limisphaerales bacterium]TXT52781.1 MAG: hypothetical protein FD140_324 [Limisphaerales bacterium]
MKLLAPPKLWNDRRRIGGFLDFLGGNKSSSSVSTTTTVTNNTASTVTDAYNNTYNRVNNTSVNLGDQFAAALGMTGGGEGGGLDLKQIALWLVGGFVLVIIIKLVLKRF